MHSRTAVLPAASQSLTAVLGIDPLLRGGMKVRLQLSAGTVFYGSKESQPMVLTGTHDDLKIANSDDLHLRGPGTVNILAY